jgi:hypothetical protein
MNTRHLQAAQESMQVACSTMNGCCDDDRDAQKGSPDSDGHGDILIVHDLLPHLERRDPFKDKGSDDENNDARKRESGYVDKDFPVDDVHILAMRLFMIGAIVAAMGIQ